MIFAPALAVAIVTSPLASAELEAARAKWDRCVAAAAIELGLRDEAHLSLDLGFVCGTEESGVQLALARLAGMDFDQAKLAGLMADWRRQQYGWAYKLIIDTAMMQKAQRANQRSLGL